MAEMESRENKSGLYSASACCAREEPYLTDKKKEEDCFFLYIVYACNDMITMWKTLRSKHLMH